MGRPAGKLQPGGCDQHCGGEKRYAGTVTAEEGGAQQLLKARVFYHIHGRCDVARVANVETGGAKLRGDLPPGVYPGSRPAVVQWFRKPAKKRNAIPLQN